MSQRGVHRAPVLKYEEASGARVEDQLAAEEPLEIRVNGEPLTVVMRTPGDDAELALGFLFGEGIIRAAGDVSRLAVRPNGEHPQLENILDVELHPEAPGGSQRWQRNFLSASSCGLCGMSTIEAIHRNAPPLPNDDLSLEPELIYGLDEQLRRGQALFSRTGGLHAAGLFTADRQTVVIREDIGRHNAVDKVIGYSLQRGLLPLSRHLLMVSGRTSFEIVQKALQARLPVLIAVSAPSSLARELAQTSNQTLIGFVRGRSLNVYAGRQRLRA
jgi:FdhD protein